MPRSFRWIGFALLGVTLTGCVSQDQYSALKLERDRIAEQLVTAQREASTSKSAADAYKNQLDALAANGSTQIGLVNNLTAENATLKQQLDDINRRYQEALNRPMNAPAALPPALTNELNQFAAQNPDLVDFDSARGIVKFKSDVTFSVGDATITAKAREAIDRFAKILNSAGASQYELLVAGHTDSTPVHNQATIAAGHKDNWYLSAHRAISVGNELMKNGVNSARIGVVPRRHRRRKEGRQQGHPEAQQGHGQHPDRPDVQQVIRASSVRVVGSPRPSRSRKFDNLLLPRPAPRPPRRGAVVFMPMRADARIAAMNCLLITLGCLSSCIAVVAAPATAPAPPPRAARSVHLHFPAPDATAFYNELTVERSTRGSYFMACGFNHGYFGIQEKGDGRKVVLFSVWDPTKGDDAKAVPEDQRVEVLHKDDDVTVKRFGGEGTGGQCFFDFDWQLGQPCRFLVKADVQGEKTSYAGHFYLPAEKRWKHLVTFRTRTGGQPLRGLYSFVEDFRRDTKSAGELRRATFGNGWVLDTKGAWQPLLEARFTASNSPTEARETIDAGVAADGRFYLQTGGETKMSRGVNSSMEGPAVGARPADLP
jgi:flagellar motor protein MotB